MASKKPKTFKSMLAGLTCEKNKIGHLTAQARADLQYQETLAEIDVNAITSFIVNKNADDRLAGLYLIDSICQNVGGKYVPLFEEHIFPLIETTYRYGSSSTRKSLCKILNIWKSRKIFPIDVLRNIYKAISSQQNSSQAMSNNMYKKPSSSMPYNPSHQNFRNGPPGTNGPYGGPPPSSYYPPPNGHGRPPYNNNNNRGGPPSHNQWGPPPPNPYHQQGGGPPLYPPPHHNNHHQPLLPHQHHHGPPPMGHNNMNNHNNSNNGGMDSNDWRAICNKFNISQKEYERIINELIMEISEFIESPYSYNNGIFVETPQLKNANWSCRQQLIDEFRKSISEFNNNNIDITRKLYFITTELKHEGVNTAMWQEKLNRIAPFLSSSSSSSNHFSGDPRHNSTSSASNVFGEICEFYNSIDGCRSGSKCKYLHVTDAEAELRRKLYKRVEGRYEYKDIKFMDDCSDLKITTFYTYFGNKQELKKKHGRSVSLLYSKKLKICPNCSLRITSDLFSKHMKWHFHRRNIILTKKRESGFKSQQYGMYRNWYNEEQEWLININTNKSGKDDFNKEINPFDSIKNNLLNLNNSDNSMMTINNNNKMDKDKDINLYSESQVLLNGISQRVICEICQEEFAKSNKEYNAQKDDWILKNACYIDGTTSKSYSNGKPLKDKLIVHKKCYELKRKQSTINNNDSNDDDDPLKPKLHNPDNVISKIEDQLNDKRHGKNKIFTKNNKKKKTQNARKRARNDSLWRASDDDMDSDDDDDDEDSDNNDENDNDKDKINGNSNNTEIGNPRKKRKLNPDLNGDKLTNGKEEMDGDQEDVHDDDDDDDEEFDDEQGIGLDDLNAGDAIIVKLNTNNNNDNENKDNDNNEENKNNNNDDQQEEEEENDELSDLEDIDLDDDELANLDDIDVDDDEDENDENEPEITLFDPNAYNETYQRGYGYGHRYG